MSRSAIAPLAFVAFAALTACGPSMKNLVESDMRFEHCYRIDEDPSTPLDNKRACWREWTSHYAKGQDRSRVGYAKDRVKVLNGAIATGPVAPLAPTAAACPPPVNPYSPPPSIAPKDEKSAAAPGTATVCSDTCTKAWRACSTPCGTESGCMINCDAKFRECVRACL
jgi:hypothetical protein